MIKLKIVGLDKFNSSFERTFAETVANGVQNFFQPFTEEILKEDPAAYIKIENSSAVLIAEISPELQQKIDDSREKS